MQEAYEISYGIYDHDNEDHPWALALKSDREDYTSYSPMYHLFHRYRLRDIHKRWGLSITDFLELPHEYVELIFEITEQEDKKDQKAYNDVKRSLDEPTR